MDLFGNKTEQIEQLREYQERLRDAVGKLLQQVDEADLKTKFVEENAALSRLLRDACNDLVKLGDQLPKIDQLITHKKTGEARKLLMASLEKANGIAKRVHTIRRAQD